MLLETTFFYIFATGIVLSAAGVVFLKGPVHSALSLVLAFVGSACLWLMLQAEFLALILVLVYVGAVMTLFLFVVMTIDLDEAAQQKSFVRYFPMGILLMGVLGVILFSVFKPTALSITDQFVSHSENYSNIKALGNILYTQYAYPFELAAVLLLIAIVAAISLTPRTPGGRQRQNIEKQTYIRRSDRIRLVNLPTEKKP